MYSPVRTAREAFWHGLCFILFGLATVTARPAGLLLRFPTPVVVVGLLLDESSQTPIPLSGTPTPCFHLLLVTPFFLFFLRIDSDKDLKSFCFWAVLKTDLPILAHISVRWNAHIRAPFLPTQHPSEPGLNSPDAIHVSEPTVNSVSQPPVS